MKGKYILAMLTVAAAAAGASAQSEKRDTLSTFVNPDKVTIVETEKGSVIEVAQRDTVWRGVIDNKNEKPERMSFREYLAQSSEFFNNKTILDITVWAVGMQQDDKEKDAKRSAQKAKRPKRYYPTEFAMGGIGIGCDFVNGARGVNVAPGKSYEINWLTAAGYQIELGRKDGLLTGLGFSWRNYRLTDGRIFTTENGILDVGAAPDGKTMCYSNFTTFSMQVPMLWQHTIPVKRNSGFGFELSAGPILTFTPTAWVKSVLFDADGGREVWRGDITNQRRVAVDLFGAVGLPAIGSFYVRYTPMKVMATNAPFNFNTLTVGYMLGL